MSFRKCKVKGSTLFILKLLNLAGDIVWKTIRKSYFRNMKNTLLFILVLFSTDVFGQLAWESKASLPEYGLNSVKSFGVNGKAFFCLGIQANNGYSKKLWEFDPATEIWTQKTNYPGGGSAGCLSFVLGTKAYVGLGQSPSTKYSDFYEYNATSDAWTQKASFPGGARNGITSFTIGDTAYVVGGSCGPSTCFYNQLWMYVPSTNSWTRKADFPGGARIYLSAFSIGQYGYVGNGTTSSNSLSNNFWKYSPSTNSWTAIATMPGTARRYAVNFVVDGLGYVGTGTFNWTPHVNQNDFYSYNPSTNSWTNLSSNNSFIPRHDGALAQVNDSTIFISTGVGNFGRLPDLWKLKLDFDTCDYYDTTFVQDTTFVTDTLFINDTTFTTIFDTSYIQIEDTLIVYKLDTIDVYVIDTLYTNIYDTMFLTSYDTIRTTIYDTISVYNYDTITRYINTAVEDTLNFTTYSDNCGNISHKIYPNPVSNWVYVYSNKPSCYEGFDLVLIDALGQILDSKKYGNLVGFDVKGYARSLYFIRLIGDNGMTVFSKKIVLK
ncbi:MAG: N-acetylneuraminic acid mutarotase [Lentimonas sp.]|jgi:N-acetylneuraminic acid mutarotase